MAIRMLCKICIESIALTQLTRYSVLAFTMAYFANSFARIISQVGYNLFVILCIFSTLLFAEHTFLCFPKHNKQFNCAQLCFIEITVLRLSQILPSSIYVPFGWQLYLTHELANISNIIFKWCAYNISSNWLLFMFKFLKKFLSLKCNFIPSPNCLGLMLSPYCFLKLNQARVMIEMNHFQLMSIGIHTGTK